MIILIWSTKEGQIRTEAERTHTVLLDAKGIALTDFASPKINEVRNEGDLKDLKLAKIEKARGLVKEKFGYK